MQRTAGEELIDLLEKPGEGNRKLDQIMENFDHGNFTETIPVGTGADGICAPCGIYRKQFHETENILNETGKYYMVTTEGKKGHLIRNMAVQKQHGEIPPVEDSVEMIDTLVRGTEKQIKHLFQKGELEDPEFILYGSMNTFPEHFHLVTSDITGGNPEDLGKINSYLRFDYKDDKHSLNTDKSMIRDNFGNYIEKWSEETDLFRE